MVVFGIEGVIKSCYNKGEINEIYTGSGGTVGIGGIVGYDYNGRIENCYNAGKITSEREDGIGSIVGFSANDNIKNCYYDSSDSFGGTGTPIKFDIMKTEEFVDMLNNHDPKRPYEYDSNNINEGYPILIAEDFNGIYYEDEYIYEDEDDYEDDYEYASDNISTVKTKTNAEKKSIVWKTVGLIIVLGLVILGFLYYTGEIDFKKGNKN
jgi:hypothetical protein